MKKSQLLGVGKSFLSLFFLLVCFGFLGCSGGGGGGSAGAAAIGSSSIDAPSNVQLEEGEGQIKVSWDPVANATAYRLYWGLSSDVSTSSANKKEVSANSYTITGLNVATTYYLIITAVNQANQESSTYTQKTAKTTSSGFYRDENGVITDGSTDMQWYSAPSSIYNSDDFDWYYSRDWAISLKLDGGDWRMPTMSDLRTLYPKAASTGFFPSKVFVWSADVKDIDDPKTNYDDSTAWCYRIEDNEDCYNRRNQKYGYYFSGGYVALAVRFRK